ncbi:MAG: outer membrane protein assembly factor BamB family protein, partial [bacterium JZ-2024 1]
GFLAAPIVRDFTGKGKHEILITDRAGKVALIDGQSGRELWTAAMGNAAVGAGILWESPSGPVVIVGSRDQWVYAFRATNGELLWRYYARNPVSSRLFHAISPQGWNLAIFCAEGQGIQALNLQWQFLQWRYDFRGNCVGEPLIANVIGDAEPEVIVVSDRKVVHTVTGSQASITFLDMLELPGTPASGAGVLFRGLDRAGLLAVTVTDLKLPRTPVGSVILGYSFHPLSPPDVSYPVAGLAGQDSTL